ncbi:hypothetical protein [Helicobacter rodentium]|uniref:hypothetical protein n=1 Tax=Helicobacter rodentium TaxID=59617 RepID=UPI002352DFC0|nr:hypothetical protein [Helicobacter rodentium]
MGGGAEEMYSLTLWLGIPGERRVWLEQWEGIPLILKNLSLYFPSIKVYVDGMTAYDGERIEVTSNLEAFWKIVENTKEAFEVSDSASCKDAKQTAASLRGSVANEAIHSPLVSLRGEAEAIHNQAKSNFNDEITTGEIKDYRLPRDSNESLAMTKQLNSNESDIMDCHENQRFSRNDEVADALVSRHCERSEAIHNVDNQKIRNGSRGNDRGDSKNSCVIYGAKGEQIAFKSLSGYDYRTKICYCAMCDIVISETSTTSLTPFYFCKKPGVAFYCIYQANNMTHINMARDFAKQIPHLKVPLPQYHAYEGGERKGAFFNYHLSPEHLYNLAAESLEELSLEGKLANFGKDNPLKMHRLPVPPVELYAKLYELEKKTLVSLKGNKAEAEILKKIESQKKLLEAQKLVSELEKNPIASSISQSKTIQGAKERVHHHLAYKLGMALIVCSKSLWGYITMPYVLSYIKAQHQFEQEKYQKAVARNPALKLPKLESYADYEDALKEQQCYTYKLGAALMEADKTWLKGGYLWFYLESKRLKREFERERK